MDNPQEQVEIIPPAEPQEGQLVPEMPAIPAVVQPEENSLVTDEDLTDAYKEIRDLFKEDREQIKDLTTQIADMVVNGGDASPATKELLGSLMKTQTDLIDKMVKVADLKTRVKLKERDTFPAYLRQQQNNTINIKGSKRTTRLLIDAIHQNMRKKEDNDADD